MKTIARFTHSISLTEEQEKKLIAVRTVHKISIVKMLMATVDALEPTPSPEPELQEGEHDPVAAPRIEEED